MESVFKKIAEKRFDDEVHREFIKFSKGVFTYKYLIDCKRQKAGWSIKTGAEFANFLVKNCLSKAQGSVAIKGVIVSTFDLRNELPFEIENVKQFMGVKQLVVNTSVEPKVLLALMDKHPKAFYALSFSYPLGELKIKAKAPKSAKPAAGGDKEPAAEFCSLKTTDKDLVQALLFDVPDFTELSISHTLTINDITLPKGEKDPVKIRENAVRKGTIARIITADGKQTKKEYPFEA